MEKRINMTDYMTCNLVYLAQRMHILNLCVFFTGVVLEC